MSNKLHIVDVKFTKIGDDHKLKFYAMPGEEGPQITMPTSLLLKLRSALIDYIGSEIDHE